jgi:DEAD/DEAH box helicase domain-containing protein
MALLDKDVDDVVRGRCGTTCKAREMTDGLRTRLMKSLEELVEERAPTRSARTNSTRPRPATAEAAGRGDEERIDNLLRERDKMLELIKEINAATCSIR